MNNGETQTQEKNIQTNCEPQSQEEINTNNHCETAAGGCSDKEFFEKALVNGALLEMPVSDKTFYVSKIFDIYEKVSSNSCTDQERAEAIQDVEQRIIKAASVIEEFQNKEVPDGAEELHYDILSGFDLFYNGLTLFAKYIESGDIDLAIESMKTIYVGDTIIKRVNDDIAVAESTSIRGIII
jgi:soluble cytochrome b562